MRFIGSSFDCAARSGSSSRTCTKNRGVFQTVQPHTVYLPHWGDAHSDHTVAFDAASACTKWFRYPSIREVLSYETLSETGFHLGSQGQMFQPNVFVDIEAHLDKKVQIVKEYASEIAPFPFPRSEEAVRSLAAYRGSFAGCKAAEAMTLLKQIRR